MSDSEERYALRKHEDITICRLKITDLTTLSEVRRTTADLNKLIDAGARKFILDLKYTTQYSSAALGMLVEIAKRLNLLGGKLVLSHPEHIQPLLNLTRIGRLFDTAPDPKAASKMFGDAL